MEDAGHRVLVVGAGALGTFVAQKLAGSGKRVTVLARGKRLSAIRAYGLQTEIDDRVELARVEAQDTAIGLARQDWVILCTKTMGLQAALADLQAAELNPQRIVTLQNGIEAPQLAASFFPTSTVLAARVHGFFELSGDIARHVGVRPSFHFGRLAGEDARADAEFAELLTSSGIYAEIAGDVRAELWEKFLLTAGAGGVGAALDLGVRAILDDPVGSDLLLNALTEIAALAQQKGIALSPTIVGETISFIATFPPEATTSLQRDLAAHQLSEYDSLVGTVIRMAGEIGMPTPAFDQIDRRVRESGKLHSLE